MPCSLGINCNFLKLDLLFAGKIRRKCHIILAFPIMKIRGWLTGCLLLSLVSGRAQNTGPVPSCPPPIRYTLLDGSFFIDDCAIYARPTILQPLRGTFDLILQQNTPPYFKYAVRNVDFHAGPGFSGLVHITGAGTFVRFEEVARIRDLQLAVQVQDAITNRFAYFTNSTSVQPVYFPMIEVTLGQTNGTPLSTYQMHILAAPVREVWFSVNKAITITNADGTTRVVSPGDLLSSCGRVVKSNIDLVGGLGVMPVRPDLGLDAVDVACGGEILFSIPQYVFSETLGPIQHGDLLSSRGSIVKRNQDLLAAFGVPSSAPDAGLDAVQLMPDGEILFSTQSNVITGAAQNLGRGDILSDKGIVFRSNEELLARFHPTVTNYDYGLDALYVLPSGEIWFSTEEGFTDTQLGKISPGDVLSDQGYRVFRNNQLLSAFGPHDATVDYGVDALFVVTGTRPTPGPVRLLDWQFDRQIRQIRLNWDGEGDVFQVERAPGLSGPWEPCSPILPDLNFDDSSPSTNSSQWFYRIRQW